MGARRSMYGLPLGVTFHKNTRMYEVHVWIPNARTTGKAGRVAPSYGKQVFVGAWQHRRTAEVAAPLARAALLGKPLPPELAEHAAALDLAAAPPPPADHAGAVRRVRRVAALYEPEPADGGGGGDEAACAQPASPTAATEAADAADAAATPRAPTVAEVTAAGALRLWDDHIAYIQAVATGAFKD